jgi:hypothetical protein
LNSLVSSTNTPTHPLVEAATLALNAADYDQLSGVDRQVRQPDSWLLRRCYQALAEDGSAEAAFAVVELIREREPLATYRVLPILARRATAQIELAQAMTKRLPLLRFLLQHPIPTEQLTWGEQLLSLACAAAHLGNDQLVYACLERIDQARNIWTSIFSQPELRELLAETISLVGLHPLTAHLIRLSIRQHGDTGAHFLHLLALGAAARIKANHQVERSRRLLQRCVTTVQHATLVSLLSRRYASIILGVAGDVQGILEQATTIANIQEARRESGIGFRDGDNRVLRQVKRPRANTDVDFLFYTLKDAVDQLDPARLAAHDRRAVAERLATLGTGSDGWTAAAAAAALLRLDEPQHAIVVVDKINPGDPTRSEAYRVLVEGLLNAGDEEEARIQAMKAIKWAQSLAEHHPERLVIWGISAGYLAHDQAQAALDILSRRRGPGLRARLQRILGKPAPEEHLREQALRMHAALCQGEGSRDRANQILNTIRRQAPQVLDGKALALFYTDHVLQPLLATGHYTLAWSFLHDVQNVLGRILSREQPARVEAVADLLVEHLKKLASVSPAQEEDVEADESVHDRPAPNTPLDDACAAVYDLLVHLWDGSARQGIWPAVYSIGGSLPLVITLAGSETVVEIARFTAAEGHAWRRQLITEGIDDTEAEETLLQRFRR